MGILWIEVSLQITPSVAEVMLPFPGRQGHAELVAFFAVCFLRHINGPVIFCFRVEEEQVTCLLVVRNTCSSQWLSNIRKKLSNDWILCYMF